MPNHLPPEPRVPPDGLVLARELLAGQDLAEALVRRLALRTVLGQVLSTRSTSTPGERAQAAALCTAWRSGALARLTAAWIWSGDPLVAPDVLEVGSVLPTVRLSAIAVVRSGCLPTVAVRCSGDTRVRRIGGVAVTDPTSTASECARLLPRARARRALLALDRSGRQPLEQVRATVSGQVGARGRLAALELVGELLAARAGQAGRSPGVAA